MGIYDENSCKRCLVVCSSTHWVSNNCRSLTHAVRVSEVCVQIKHPQCSLENLQYALSWTI